MNFRAGDYSFLEDRERMFLIFFWLHFLVYFLLIWDQLFFISVAFSFDNGCFANKRLEQVTNYHIFSLFSQSFDTLLSFLLKIDFLRAGDGNVPFMLSLGLLTVSICLLSYWFLLMYSDCQALMCISCWLVLLQTLTEGFAMIGRMGRV